MLLSVLIHAGVLLAVAGWTVSVRDEEELSVRAAVSNEAALLEESSETFAAVELPPVAAEPPSEDDPPDPLPPEEFEPLPEPQPRVELPAPLPIEPPRRLSIRMARPPLPKPPPDAAAVPQPQPLPMPAPPEVASSDVVEEADVLQPVLPIYPRRAFTLGLEGTVVLLGLVKADGTIEACEIETSSGHDLLDQAARKALLQWRFKPRVVDGIPRPFTARVPFRFFLPRDGR